MSSQLYSLRREIRNLLLQDNLWGADEVLIKRRSDIWNDVATATSASRCGQCIVVGVAEGSLDNAAAKSSSRILMRVTIPVTLVELPNVSDEQPEAGQSDEDDRWEATVLRLQGSPLGRSASHYSLEFERFEDVEDDQYVIRQTVFKTTLYLKLA